MTAAPKTTAAPAPGLLAIVWRHRLAALLVVAVIIAVAPLAFPSSFYFRIGALIFINAIAVTGLVILFGYAGQISLGHAGFAGIGAYAAALLPVHLGVPPILALALGAVLAGALAYGVGRPILHLKGHYLAVATLGLGLLVFMVLTNEAWLTGGPDGMPVQALGIRSVVRDLTGARVTTSQVWYWFAAAVMLLGMAVAINLRDSRTGRALRALHDSEVAARTIGVDTARFKLYAFVISAVYASIAGSMLAQFNRFITPDIANFLYSVQLVTMAVLGGAGSVVGGLTGAGLLTALPQVLTVLHEYEHLMLGLIMMVVMIFLPQGLVPSLAELWARRRR